MKGENNNRTPRKDIIRANMSILLCWRARRIGQISSNM